MCAGGGDTADGSSSGLSAVEAGLRLSFHCGEGKHETSGLRRHRRVHLVDCRAGGRSGVRRRPPERDLLRLLGVVFGSDSGAGDLSRRQPLQRSADGCFGRGGASRKAYRAELAARLKSIDRTQLGGQDRISYDVFARELGSAARFDAIFGKLPFGATFDEWSPVNQFDGPQFWLPQLAAATPFRTVADYEAYLKRLAQIPRQLRQLQQRMQAGIDAGWLPPGVSLQRVPSQLDAHLNADVTQVPLYRPFTQFPADVSAPDQKRLGEAGRRVLADDVVPAFKALKDFYQFRYLPAAQARKGIGASELPGGAEYYAATISEMTTTSMKAREIHELDLHEVARIESEMNDVTLRSGFSGTREEFARFLHESPQFYYSTGDELLAGYRDIAKRADAELPKLFAELPRTPYGV